MSYDQSNRSCKQLNYKFWKTDGCLPKFNVNKAKDRDLHRSSSQDPASLRHTFNIYYSTNPETSSLLHNTFVFYLHV